MELEEPKTTEPPSFLTLPPEIREEIYRIILHPDANRVAGRDEYTDYDYRPALVLFPLSTQLYYEARRVFRDLNVFVRIETPWPEAHHHVAFEGHVPILMKHARAAAFRGHSLAVAIGAPHTLMQEAEPQHFVILLDDLPKFAATWRYADLTNPGLNGYLTLTLQLRDPHFAPELRCEEPRRQLLLPFGAVKGLRETVVTSDAATTAKPFFSVENELRAAQQVPHASPAACLAETARLKAEGTKELTAGRYHQALALYTRAWEAMHVVVKGRQRHVHAEAFFAGELREEPYVGKNGQLERLVLRVQLVANTVLAYLKLEDWDEARFWGMRTITTMRQSIGAHDRHDVAPEEEAVTGFPAAAPLGRIHYRTALAYKELGNKAEARKLLRVASVYMPTDPNVKKEIAACALRLG
ncbi:hypothetical protein PG994_003784 [Apiospora phragmitis]|uniref:Tetratricopeptide repeat protein n=1 Tax=Apiospora phragmitis TaxID=2905665 RepID=A0ABR1VZ74_9PEZI